MSREGYEFGFWALLIVGAGTALLMWQHLCHTEFLVNVINGQGLGSDDNSVRAMAGAPPLVSVADAAQAGAVDKMAGPPRYGRPTAQGVWSPLGPDEVSGPFLYRPPATLQ